METLDAKAKQRIEAAIAEVEARTAGELVVVSVPTSDGHEQWRMLYASLLALSMATLAHFVWPHLDFSWLMWLEIAVAIAGYFLFGIGPLLRRIVPSAQITACAERRAREVFLEHELFSTRDRSGVLILISELEHRVVILGDSGIHSRMPQGAWQAHVARIVGGFRSGHPDDAICAVIAELGKVLAEHSPRRADDTDELPNTVRQPAR